MMTCPGPWRVLAGLGLPGLVLVLGGCGGEGTSEQQLRIDAASPTASSSAGGGSASPSSTTDPGSATPIPRDPPEGVFTRGLDPSSTESEAAVAQTWFSYWEEVTRMYREGGAEDRDTLYGLATGQAASGPLEYAEDMRADGNTQRGGGIGSITSIQVAGDTATVRSCFRDFSYDVDPDGDPVEIPANFFSTVDTLRREGPDWRLVTQTIPQEGVGRPCSYR